MKNKPYFLQHSVLCNLNAMLTFLDMQFEGNPHSGLDDSFNISRICLRLLEDGAFIDQNERIISLKTPTPYGKDVIIIFLYNNLYNNLCNIILL